jgi:hypothetical protein
MEEKGTVSIPEVARWLKTDQQTVRVMIQLGLVDWGICFKRPGSSRYTYIVFREPFKALTGYGGVENA